MTDDEREHPYRRLFEQFINDGPRFAAGLDPVKTAQRSGRRLAPATRNSVATSCSCGSFGGRSCQVVTAALEYRAAADRRGWRSPCDRSPRAETPDR